MIQHTISSKYILTFVICFVAHLKKQAIVCLLFVCHRFMSFDILRATYFSSQNYSVSISQFTFCTRAVSQGFTENITKSKKK